MESTRIAIVGGGLSGLYAARLLQQRGVHDYLLLEARPRWGGRIAAVADGLDLGPTWYWPDQQAELADLIDDLGLKAFPQFDEGDMVVERSAQQAPVRMTGFSSSPASMRLQGGMASVIDALHQGLDPQRLRLGQRVRRIVLQGLQLELEIEATSGEIEGLRAEQVLLALPPRLAEASIEFSPALPGRLARRWRDTPTWMAPHAKYLAVYDRPFWREQGLSGEARSAHGPLAEIHDASMPEGSAALFGFLGVPAQLRRTLADEQLRLHCRAQLARLFGPEAASPRFDQIQDWATESLTSTEADAVSAGHAPWVPEPSATEGVWQGRLTGIASEWSTQFPGYLAGAIDAARYGVETWLSGQALSSS